MTNSTFTNSIEGSERFGLQKRLIRLSYGLVGVALIFAGLAKVISPDATVSVLAWAGLPFPSPQVITGILPGVEIALGLALLLGWSSRLLLGGSVVLLVGFTAFLTYLAFGRYRGHCGCLGPVIDRWSGGGPLAGMLRNLALLALLAWPTVLNFSRERAHRRGARTRSGPVRVAVLLFSSVLSISYGVRASAQSDAMLFEPWAPGFESPLRSVFSDRMVTQIAEWFDMTDDQKVVLESLREDHQANFDVFVADAARTWQPLEDAMQALPRSTLARTQAHVDYEIAVAPIADRQETLDMEFLDSVRMVLDEGQIERWDEFRTWLNRRRWCGRAGMYLEQPLDLVALLVETDRRFPDEPAGVPDEFVDEYARQMDDALRKIAAFEIDWARNRMRNEMKRIQTDGERTWIGDSPDPRKQRRETEERLSLNGRIRDLNHRYAKTFAFALPEPKAKEWRRLYRESVLQRVVGYSKLSQQTNDFIDNSIQGSHRFYRLVRQIHEKITNLDDDQRAAIDAIVAQRDASLDAAFRGIVDAHDELADSSFRGVSAQGRAELEAKYRESLEAFAEVEQQSKRALLAILTPEQRSIIESVDNQ